MARSIEELVSAFTEQEAERAAAALPPGALWDAAQDRGFFAGERTGALVQVGAQQAASELQLDASVMTNPDARINAADQVAFAENFWRSLGRNTPSLTDPQIEGIHTLLGAHPERRILPVPLLPIEQYMSLADSARRVFTGSSLAPDVPPLLLPVGSDSTSNVLQETESSEQAVMENVVHEDQTPYSLYRTYGGMVGWADVVSRLVGTEKTVRGSDGIMWIFPIMRLGPDAHRHQRNKTVDSYHKRTTIFHLPDTFMSLQLLHQAAGLGPYKGDPPVVDVTNKQQFTNEQGRLLRKLVTRSLGIVTVGFSTSRQIHVDMAVPDSKSTHRLGLREIISAI